MDNKDILSNRINMMGEYDLCINIISIIIK